MGLKTKTQQCCYNCYYGVIKTALRGDGFEPEQMYDVEYCICRRYPEQIKKCTGDWCGEWKDD